MGSRETGGRPPASGHSRQRASRAESPIRVLAESGRGSESWKRIIAIVAIVVVASRRVHPPTDGRRERIRLRPREPDAVVGGVKESLVTHVPTHARRPGLPLENSAVDPCRDGATDK